MKLSSVITIIVLCIIYCIQASAQRCCLKGTVTDLSSDNPMSYVNAILTTTKDSSLILGTITNEQGGFVIEDVKQGTYQLKLSFIGYQSVVMKDILLQPGTRDVGVVSLKVLSENISAVTVKATKPPITYKVDRKVIDAGSFPGAEVGMDLLENIPSVQVDFEGKLTYRGDGTFKVFINGHPAANGEEKLRQIPADRIDRIEVITNPSAKYDAEGTAGIIMVMLKKNRLEGYAISTSLAASTNDNYRWMWTVEKQSEKGGWYVNGQLMEYIYSDSESEQVQTIWSDDYKYQNKLDYDFKAGGTMNYIELGFNYDLTDNDNIDFSGNISPVKRFQFSDKTGHYKETVFDQAGNVVNHKAYDFMGRNKTYYQYAGATLAYEHAFNKKRTHLLSAYIDCSTYLRDFEEKQIDSKIYDTYTERTGYIGAEQNEILIQGKLDYSLPVSENTIFESGLEVNTDHIPKVTSVSGSFDEHEQITPFPNEPINQQVDFFQDIYAGFLSFKSKWGKLDYQMGLRIEHTERKSDYSFEEEDGSRTSLPTRKNFVNLFPSAHATYSFSETHQLSASFSRRIKRPNYWSLIPLQQYMDPFCYYTGNGDLLPSYTNAIEVGYKKSWDKNFIGLEVFGRAAEDIIQDYIRTDTANITVEIPENVGKSLSIGAEFMAGVDLFAWWNSNFSISLYSYQLDVQIDEINKNEKQFNTDSRLNNTFRLPKAFTLKWDVHYKSPYITAQSKRDAYVYSNFSVKKGFKDNKWQITFSAKNIFSSINYDIEQKSYNYHNLATYNENGYCTIKVAYVFNNQE
ncbi:TonB-dependent receptor [Marinilabiliaceae bacterium JC017]|nr:TonB-dependent receptor [Marinilabiliaceae bacterium JC017]